MALSLTVGGVPLKADAATLKALWAKRDLAFDCDGKLAALLDGALSLVPATNKFDVDYTSDAASWVPDGSVVKIGLQGGIGGSIEIVNGGELVSYMDGLDAPSPTKVTVAAGRSYVRLCLHVTLSPSVSGKYSGGDFGVSASVNAAETYTVTFCKAFDPSTTVRAAVLQAFDSFVVPFTPTTLTELRDGDYLLHAFDGKVGFAVGAYAGVDQVLYAGQASVDVLKSAGSSWATLTPSVKPTVSEKVSLDFKLSYEGKFEALLWKSETVGKLHLYKADTTTATTSLSAGLTIDLNGAVDIKQHVTEHLQTLSTSLQQAAGGPDSVGGKAVGAVVAAAPRACQNYADEVTDKLSSWLDKVNQKTNLELAIENTHARTLLAGCAFDLSSPGYATAWDCATKGDLHGALATGAVTVDTGSGLEKDYQTKTSFDCNFFNLWHMTSWSDFSKNVSMVYAGNNVFHMVAKVGRTTETDTIGAMHSMDMYFAASVDAAQAGAMSNTSVALHIAMNAKNDPKAAEGIAQLLRAMDDSPATVAMVRDLRAFNTNTKNGSVQLLVTIPSAGFGKVQSDAKVGPHDQANWDAFAQAADDLEAWLAGVTSQTHAYLRNYAGWQDVNKASTGKATADRTQFGSGAWPSSLDYVDTPLKRQLITYSMNAGQRYMNFCAALQQLGTLTSTQLVTATWESLLALITDAVKDETSVDFLKPMALATVRLCKGATVSVTGPVAPAIPVDHFSIEVSL